VRYSLCFLVSGHMVKSRTRNRAKGARRGRRTTPKNVQMKNQKSSKARAAPMRQGVALGRTTKRRATRMYQEGDAFVVEHDEYVADIFTDSQNDFAYEIYNLNPGDPATFPWLSNIAVRYEEYEAEELTPHYETAAPTTASGKVILAIDFDPGDSTDAGTKQELLNDDRTKSGPVWQSFDQTVDRPKLRKRLFVRNIDDGADGSLTGALLRQQDIGHLFVATTSCSLGGSAMLGELWIRSKIRFYTPVLHSGLTVLSSTGTFGGYTVVTPITDALQGLFLGADVSDNFAVGNFPSGVAISTPDVVAGVLPALGWVFANSLSAVPNQTTLIKFLRDWAGTIQLEVSETSGSTSLPAFGSLVAGTVCELGRAAGSISPGPSYTNQAQVEASGNVVSTTIAGLVTGVARATIVVAAMAGMGLALTVPGFTPNGSMLRSIKFFPSPMSLTAFKRQLNAKITGIPLPVGRPKFTRAVPKTYSHDDDGPTTK